MNDNPGGLYRYNYQRSAVPLDDSQNARRRLLSLFMKNLGERERFQFAEAVGTRIGADYPMGSYGFHHADFWLDAEIGTVLSAITIWWGITNDSNKRNWLVKIVQTVFDEEHLGYRIASEGGVHPRVDELFERDRIDTIAGLNDDRFKAARAALQKAFQHLKTDHPSGKGLIREVFEAAESTFLAVVANPKVNRLNAQAVANELKPKLLSRYSTFGDAEDKVERLLLQFKDWVDTAHPYRHGTAVQQEHEAPVDYAVLMASQGMGFIRFLAAL